MFKLNGSYEIVGRNLKCDYIRYSPAETSKKSNTNIETYLIIPRENSVFPLINSYNDRKLNLAKKLIFPDMQMVIKLGPTALFSYNKLSTSSGDYLEKISHSHIVLLLYNLKTGAKESDDLSFGFDRDCERRHQ